MPNRGATGRRIRQYRLAVHGERTDYSDCGMLLNDTHHFFHARRVEPVIGKHEFAVFCFGRDLANRVIMIFNDAKEPLVADHSDSGIFCRIFLSNCERLVGAAVVDDGVVPIGVRLAQNTLDALREMLGAVVRGRQYTDPRWRIGLQSIIPSDFTFPTCVAIDLATLMLQRTLRAKSRRSPLRAGL